METFYFTVTVDAADKEQAYQVMNERICFEEDYGFPYTVSWDEEPWA